jgi:hypothetical protein
LRAIQALWREFVVAPRAQQLAHENIRLTTGSDKKASAARRPCRPHRPAPAARLLWGVPFTHVAGDHRDLVMPLIGLAMVQAATESPIARVDKGACVARAMHFAPTHVMTALGFFSTAYTRTGTLASEAADRLHRTSGPRPAPTTMMTISAEGTKPISPNITDIVPAHAQAGKGHTSLPPAAAAFRSSMAAWMA